MKKSHNTGNVMKMESMDEESYYRRCEEYYGIVADQGTEKGVTDVNKLSVAGSAGRDNLAAKS